VFYCSLDLMEVVTLCDVSCPFAMYAFSSLKSFFCSQGLPCHLYFDLEFNRKVNLGKNGDEMVDLLISVVLEALHEKYEIHGDYDWIVELDSSTEGMDFLQVNHVLSIAFVVYCSFETYSE